MQSLFNTAERCKALFWKSASAVCLCVTLTACGSNLDCSSAETTKIIYDYMGTQFLKPGTKYQLRNIVTEDKGKNSTSCSATMDLEIPASPGFDDKYKEARDFKYRLQRTDDGRLLVTHYGLF